MLICPRPANRVSDHIYVYKCACNYMYETYVISANVLVKEKTIINVFVAYCHLVIFSLLHFVPLRCSRLACFGSFSKRSFCSFAVSFVCRLRQVFHHSLFASRSHALNCSAVWRSSLSSSLSLTAAYIAAAIQKENGPASILFDWSRDL